MAVRKRKRQPRRLLALADENLLVGIGHLLVGCRHAFVLVVPILGLDIDHTASCRAIEPGQLTTADNWIERRVETIFRRSLACSCIAATLAAGLKMNRPFEGGGRL
jgi:hypothetical protein